MISSEDILSLNFYNYGNPFTGSCRGMRYRIIKQKEAKDEEGNILKEEGLLAAIWPEPFAYEKTAEELKTTKLFPLTEEGKEQVVEWLNTSWENGEWKPGFTASQLEELTQKSQNKEAEYSDGENINRGNL